MPIPENKRVAAIFAEIADLYDIKGGHQYRARSLRRVGKIIDNLGEPVEQSLEFGRLQKRRGIGEGAILRIKQILRTGACHDLTQLRREMPPTVRDLLQLDGIGPKTVRLLYTHLQIGSIVQLEHAIRTGRLARLPRFGARAEDKILRAIEDYRAAKRGGTPLPDALAIGGSLVEALAEMREVQRVVLAGSARRRRALTGDLDVLVATYEPLKVCAAFAALPQVRDVRLRGDKRTSVRLHSGQQVDLRTLVPETFGAGLHYFTGSQRHNIFLRARGNRRGLKISEYGVFIREGEIRLAGEREEEIFAAVGLPFIPPELREGDGEIKAAERGQLPRLVEQQDVQGDLRVSLPAERAVDPTMLRQLIEAAATEHKLSYVAITPPFYRQQSERSLLSYVERLREQQQRRSERDGGGSPVELLVGADVAIDPTGELCVDPVLLEQLDWVVASVVDNIDQPRDEMTRRMVKAASSGVVDCIGHPYNRLLGRREPVSFDLEHLLSVARSGPVALEINAHPDRLDLPAPGCRQARRHGVPVAIGSSAPGPDQLDWLRFGVYTARRGWLERRDVLNCCLPAELKAWRQARLRRVRGMVDAPTPDVEGYVAEVNLLERALRVPALDDALHERLRSWLQGTDDRQLAAALSAISDNPMQKAFELLLHSEAAPTTKTDS